MTRINAPPVSRAPVASAPRPTLMGGIRTRIGTIKMKMTTAAKNIGRRVGNRLKRFKRKRDDAGNVEIGAGARDNGTVPKTPEEAQTPEALAQRDRQKPDDPNSQHSEEGKAKTKKNFMDSVKSGAIAGLAMLPMAILLAAMIQGLIDCENIDKKEVDITDVTSAAWPEYPEWWPDWLPSPQSDKNKVWLSYSPGIHLLTTDTIKVTVSNTSGTIDTIISGEHGIMNNDDDAVTMIEVADNFAESSFNFSNVTAKFEISTDCLNRMVYAAGHDINTLADAGSDLFSNFFGSIPWRTIFIVVVCIFAFILFMKGVSIVRS